MVDIKYPFFLRSNAPAPHVDINGYIDAVLQVVYDHINITMSARTSRRNVIFASFNPDVCHALNLKQPNFAVFYECHCGYDVAGDVDRPAVGSGQQRYAESIKEAVRFAKNCNLLGIICAALPLVRVPFLIKAIKESGLLVATFGKENGQAANVELQSRNGVDGIVMDGVYRVLNSASI